MKIQPIDVDSQVAFAVVPVEPAKPPVQKSLLKRLFDRQFSSVLRISSVDKPPAGEQLPFPVTKDDVVVIVAGGAEFEPSSVCLAKMVQNYMEDSNDKPLRGGRNRCNCFNPNGYGSSDDELDPFYSDAPTGDAFDILKSLVPCASVMERNLLADVSMIVEKNRNHKQNKDDLRKIVTVGLRYLRYDSSICKSRWEKTPSFPAGEYEYIDVVVEGERVLIDVDFRSEFEIARSTGTYNAVLQSLPFIFVGKPDRLGQIVTVVSEAARMSLKKKEMHFPPWRKAEYMLAKWTSPFTRLNDEDEDEDAASTEAESEKGELELIFGEVDESEAVTWQPPAVKPKECGGVQGESKMVTGLASLLKEKA